MQDKFEVYNSLSLSSGEVDSIFKKFSNGSDNKYNLLKNVLETDINKSTLYDVYNALTNYSSHNKRAIRIGKKGSEEYRIDNSTMDAVKVMRRETRKSRDMYPVITLYSSITKP